MKIKINEIIVKERMRKVDSNKVKELADSIKEVGLLNAIAITKDNVLIAGNHRLEAYKLLGKDEIEVNVIEKNGLYLELAEIDENLMRNELHYLDRGKHLSRRKEIYEEMYPETKREATLKQYRNVENTEREKPSFVEETATKLNVSKSKVEQELKIARDIMPEVQEIIKEKEITKTDAIKISRMTPEEQIKVAEKIESGEVKNYKSITSIAKEYKKEQEINDRKKELKQTDKLKIFNDSCLEVLSNLEEKSIDMVLTDPPYAIDFKPSWTNNKWKEKESIQAYFELLEETCSKLQKCCKDNAHLYFFTGWVQYQEFQKIISKYFDISNLIVWVKNNTSLVDFDKRYAFKHEFIIFAKQKGNNERVLNNKQSPDVLIYNRVNNPTHSCQKPVDLLSYLINNSTIKNETVLDCFMGSGSTGEACLINDRNFIGIELEKDVFEIAKDRLVELIDE